MKNQALKVYSKLSAFVLLQLVALQTFAQDKGLDIDVDVNKKGDGDWTSNPWIWVGVAAFVIILVLAMRGGRRSAS